MTRYDLPLNAWPRDAAPPAVGRLVIALDLATPADATPAFAVAELDQDGRAWRFGLVPADPAAVDRFEAGELGAVFLARPGWRPS